MNPEEIYFYSSDNRHLFAALVRIAEALEALKPETVPTKTRKKPVVSQDLTNE
jgi:hypothetical protein